MEKEINIAEILKDKPKGTMLFDQLHNIEVELDNICTTNDTTNIWCKRELSNKEQHFGYSELGTERGWLEGMQILKPSKNMQDWSKFAWKKGDVLKSCNYLVIFDRWGWDNYTSFIASFELCQGIDYAKGDDFYTSEFSKVSDKEAKAFIEKVEEHYGGKLNLQTLEIEKSQFKDGDIFTLDSNETYIMTIGIFKGYNNEGRIKVYAAYNIGREIDYINVAAYDRTIRPATDSEKQQLFAALEKKGKRWNSETKTLEDLPKKCEFKAKDWCLMRMHRCIWRLCQYSSDYNGKDSSCRYIAVGGNAYEECIPYNDQTAHLLGTTDDWKGGEE